MAVRISGIYLWQCDVPEKCFFSGSENRVRRQQQVPAAKYGHGHSLNEGSSPGAGFTGLLVATITPTVPVPSMAEYCPRTGYSCDFLAQMT